VIGFAGVVVLMGGPSLAGEPLHVVLILCAPISWALGSILSRRLPRRANAAGDTFLQPAMQMLAGGVCCSGSPRRSMASGCRPTPARSRGSRSPICGVLVR
jgi:drug/metabolite transporter (DMT)-like permease